MPLQFSYQTLDPLTIVIAVGIAGAIIVTINSILRPPPQ